MPAKANNADIESRIQRIGWTLLILGILTLLLGYRNVGTALVIGLVYSTLFIAGGYGVLKRLQLGYTMLLAMIVVWGCVGAIMLVMSTVSWLELQSILKIELSAFFFGGLTAIFFTAAISATIVAAVLVAYLVRSYKFLRQENVRKVYFGK